MDGDWGLGTEDWELGIGRILQNPHFKFQVLMCKFRIPKWDFEEQAHAKSQFLSIAQSQYRQPEQHLIQP